MKTGVKKSLLCLCFCTLIACMWGVATTLTTPAPAYADSLVSSDMTMFKGAEVLLGEVSGLRFGYKVDNYDESKNYGMLIVPYDYLETVGITDLTDGENDYVNALNAAELPHEPIIVENLKANSSGEIRYSISNLIENNYARKFFGLGFEKTGENTYLYATQDDNARTVFEVANKAVNKLNFYDWDENDEDEMAEKALLTANETTVLNPFITKGLNFVYGTTTPTVETIYSTVGDEITLEISTAKTKNVNLDLHWNLVSANSGVVTVSDESLTATSRGSTTVTASLGTAFATTKPAAVLDSADEIEIYKNSSNANFFDGSITKNANAVGAVSLNGGFVNGSSSKTTDNGYIVFKNPDDANGKYTLNNNGTFVDFYFTGNNMPIVEFFADNLSTNVWNVGGNGFIVYNGSVASNGYTESLKQSFAETGVQDENTRTSLRYDGLSSVDSMYYYGASGYNKLTYNQYVSSINSANAGKFIAKDVSASGTSVSVGRSASGGWVSETQNYSYFSMYSLMIQENQNQDYHYRVGMYKDDDGNIYLQAHLYKIVGGTEKLFAIFQNAIPYTTSSATIPAETTVSGYILAHGALKGASSNAGDNFYSKFSYGLPYAGSSAHLAFENATFNTDGTVSLKNGTNGGGAAQITNALGYIALEGEYGLDTYMDFYFTGSNMPQVSFFNESVSNNMSATYGGVAETNSGILVINDMRYSANGIVNNQYYRFTVMPRLTAGLANSRKYNTQGSNSSNKAALSASVLETMPDQRFKYTIGFHLIGDTVYVSVDMDKVDANGVKQEDYYVLDGKLQWWDGSKNVPVTAEDLKGNRIIIYGAFNGNANSYTTFEFSAPYTK